QRLVARAVETVRVVSLPEAHPRRVAALHGHLGRVDRYGDGLGRLDSGAAQLLPVVTRLLARGVEVLGIVREIPLDVLPGPGVGPRADRLQDFVARVGGRDRRGL